VYGYNSLDRLTGATQTGASLGWTYDADGNRQQQTGASAGTGLLGAAFTYNARGRMSASSAAGGSATYIYNALSQMIEKTVGTTSTLLVYDEVGHLLYSATGSLIQETVWLGDLPVATLRPNGTGVSVYYIHADQINAPRTITRPADNAIMWRWDVDPFGTAAPNQNPQGQGVLTYNLRFLGQYYQAETGLNYNYFRDYVPLTGRYLESDPIGLAGGRNTYIYVKDNPISRTDRRGLAGVTGTGVDDILQNTPDSKCDYWPGALHCQDDRLH
jgi:RHS repeat-associated protein